MLQHGDPFGTLAPAFATQPTPNRRPRQPAAPALTGHGGCPTLAAQPGGTAMEIFFLSPLVALIAGILILIVPRLLNYIVAIYLILIGLLGLLGHYSA
jgi:hypothetical protein